MKSLNICVDIDGTITDPYYWLDYANDYFNVNFKEEDVTDYSIAKVLNIKEEEYLKFYEDKKFEMHAKEKLRIDALDELDLLYKSNNIYFVTARDKSLELLTKIYLNQYDIPFDDLYVLGTPDKVSTAQKLSCDVFIEDSYSNAVSLSSNGFKVLLLDTNYNRLPLNDNINRVYDWRQISQIIYKLSEKEDAV